MADHLSGPEGLRKLKVAANGTKTQDYFSGLPTVSQSEKPVSGPSVPISYVMGHQLLGFERDGEFSWFVYRWFEFGAGAGRQ